MADLDYDPIAPDYDARYRTGGPGGVAESLDQLARQTGVRRVAEIGCGTGHWLAGIADAWRCGLDISIGMLERARDKLDAVSLVQADAHDLPLEAQSVDLLYCVNALHHFDDPAQVVSEAARVLSATGTFAVIGMDPGAGPDRWYLYDYFPGTLEADRQRYPSTERISSLMKRAGLSRTEVRPAARIRESVKGAEVFRDPILKKNGTSQLALLSDDAFRAGITRIESEIALNSSTEFSIDVTLYLTVGRA